MPGPHIDKMFDEAIEKLTYVPMDPEQRKKATPEELEKDKASYGVEVGEKVFKDIEGSDLTSPEKQELYQRLAKAGVQHEMDLVNNPNELMRANSAMTRLMGNYMDTYAKEYMDSIYDAALDRANKVELPKAFTGKTINSPYGHVDGVSQDDLNQLHDTYGQIAKSVIQASEQNLSKLSPDARAFMQAALEPAKDNQGALNMASASTLLLRGASPKMSSDGSKMKTSPETAKVGTLLLGSSIALQSYANGINKPVGEQFAQGKPQDRVANDLRTPESMTRTTEAYKAIAGGSEKIDEYLENLKTKLQADQLKAQQARAQEAAKPFEDRIKSLQAQVDSLAKPSIGDRIKCFFKHGMKGVDGEIESLKDKIKVTETAKQQVLDGVSMEQNRQDLERMKHNQASLATVQGQAQGVVVKARLEEGGINIVKGPGKKELQDAISEGTGAKALQKELGEQIKTHEKVMSVREKLGPKAPGQGHGESQSKGMHV